MTAVRPARALPAALEARRRGIEAALSSVLPRPMNVRRSVSHLSVSSAAFSRVKRWATKTGGSLSARGRRYARSAW